VIAVPLDRGSLIARYCETRAFTETLAAPLSAEDQCAQSMPDASPVKWHRAHTTWFFEEFVLLPNADKYRRVHADSAYLFNSYYDAIGRRHPRAERGLQTRPSCGEVAAYRAQVDGALVDLLRDADADAYRSIAELVVLGLNHEQQHQELVLMDVKHLFSRNEFDPAYRRGRAAPTGSAAPAVDWLEFEGGLVNVGHAQLAGCGFSFDNEGPRHAVLLSPFRLADRLVTSGEWRAFIADGGYQRPDLWLSDGWYAAQQAQWHAPLYWELDGDCYTTLTLDGRRRVRDSEPVVHVSHFEADAYARWAGARLPTEFEWESAAARVAIEGNLLPPTSTDAATLHPAATGEGAPGLRQMFGDVWEWTSSAYLPYPRFAPAEGAVGEYNGKFMSGQMVLRGGSAVTPTGHVRSTYRNFFYPHQRWAFSGLRLAADA